LPTRLRAHGCRIPKEQGHRLGCADSSKLRTRHFACATFWAAVGSDAVWRGYPAYTDVDGNLRGPRRPRSSVATDEVACAGSVGGDLHFLREDVEGTRVRRQLRGGHAARLH